MMPDQEVGRNERGLDERRAEGPGKVNVLLAPYGVTEVPTAVSPTLTVKLRVLELSISSADVTSFAFLQTLGVSVHVSFWMAARTSACEDSQRQFSFKASFTVEHG